MCLKNLPKKPIKQNSCLLFCCTCISCFKQVIGDVQLLKTWDDALSLTDTVDLFPPLPHLEKLHKLMITAFWSFEDTLEEFLERHICIVQLLLEPSDVFFYFLA